MINNKKGIIQFGIIAIALAVIVVGFLAFNPFKADDDKPLPNPNPVPQPQPSPIVVTPTVCLSTQLVVNGQCVNCPSGSIPINGACQQTPQTTTPGVNPGFIPDTTPIVTACEPKGHFIDAYLNKPNAPLGLSAGVLGIAQAIISYRFQVENECDANFYIEGGITDSWSPLTILVTQPSACDGNGHYAGKFVKGNKNTFFDSSSQAGVISAAFFPQDYGKAGTYPVGAGVYSKCLKDGGKTIAEVNTQVKFYRPCGSGYFKVALQDWYSDSKGTCYPTGAVETTPFTLARKLI